MARALSSEDVKELGRAAGFDLVGIARAEPLEEEFDRYRAWIDAGRHGQMAYLERHAAPRRDPRLLLPEALSVIMCAVSYLAEEQVGALFVAPPSGGPFFPPEGGATNKFDLSEQYGDFRLSASAASDAPLIARYALGPDYHTVLRARLAAFRRAIEMRLGRAVRSRVCVDTAPLLERALAVRAGLGWIGKNTCLIHPRLGSFLVLGSILIDVALQPDAPMADRCGSCERCLAACPTGALIEPRVLDTRRCVSYLTIEYRGPIAEPLASRIGSRVFGCDSCQDACPWNGPASHRPPSPPSSDASAFPPKARLAHATFEDLLAIDESHFTSVFADSSIARLGWPAWRRNLAIASRNAGKQ
jgi:epoxyqueuosine reductase